MGRWPSFCHAKLHLDGPTRPDGGADPSMTDHRSTPRAHRIAIQESHQLHAYCGNAAVGWAGRLGTIRDADCVAHNPHNASRSGLAKPPSVLALLPDRSRVSGRHGLALLFVGSDINSRGPRGALAIRLEPE